MRKKRWGSRACVRRMTRLILVCACLLSFAHPALGGLRAVPGPCGMGDSGLDVRLLQEELYRRGYYTAGIDGVYGDLTVKAVERYQRDRKLPVDGRAGETTLLALFNWALSGGGEFSAFAPRQADVSGVSSLTSLPAPSGLGAYGSNVKRLQEALSLLGYYNGDTNGSFGESTSVAVAAFQADSGLKADGRADGDTIRVLFGKRPQKPGATERPDWYGGGSMLIPWGAVFQVKDVRTGEVFTCRRLEGYNHMDVEPLTPYDTFTMMDVYGGEWSWDRRPALVSYGGHVYAASMNGMPHGFISIKTNGMRGHFCIHFFGSRTHGSQLVSVTHLACVLEASRAEW